MFERHTTRFTGPSGAPAAANAGKAAYNIGQSSVSGLQAFQGSRILRFGALSVSSMGDEVVGLDAADVIHETERRRGLVLRNQRIPYNAPPGDWPRELRELLSRRAAGPEGRPTSR